MNEKQIHTDDTKLPKKIADLGSWGPGDFLSGPFAARYPPLIKEMDLGSVRPGQIPNRFHQSTVLYFPLGARFWRFFQIDALK